MISARTIQISIIGAIMLLRFAIESAMAITVSGNEVLSVFDGSYSYIEAHDASVTNIMSGGDVSWFSGFDYSTVNTETGSNVNHLGLTNFASATVNGGDLSYLQLYGQGSANIYGDANISYLEVYDSSTANIYDGTLSWVILSNLSAVSLYNGDIGRIIIDDTSVANLYVSNYSYSYGTSSGILSGQWRDGSDFIMQLKRGPFLSPELQPPPILGTNVFVHTVPLPASIFLFSSGLASLFFFRTKLLRPSEVGQSD